MESDFKHPQIFADMLTLCQLYYPLHNNLPKPFRFAVGERILAEMAECLRLIVLANSADKKSTGGCAEGAGCIRRVRAAVEVIRGFLLLAWKLRFVSHGALTDLAARLEAISKQAARWEQWFEQRGEACLRGP
jgi:hypothetical protein